MTNQVTIPLYEELLNGFDETAVAGESESIREVRKKGLESFKRLGFPTRRNEDWKYTNVTPFLQESYVFESREDRMNLDGRLHGNACIPSLDAYSIVLVNGRLQSIDGNLPHFLKVRSINDASQDANLATYFGKYADVETYHFAALNTALFKNGLFIEIDAKAVLDKPLHIVHLYTAENSLFVQPRHLFVVHRSAALSIIESIITDKKDSRLFVNSLAEVVVEENASLEHYIIQTTQSGSSLVQQTDVSQKRHSLYSNYTFSLPSADLIRNNLNLALNDDQTESHLYGLYIGAGHQLIDNHSLVDHKMPNCNSNEIYKGVLLDNATGVFNGKVFVQHDAQKTNAFQQNNNLLLSNKATINSKPQLEIFADDVKCSHGFTVGQLSKESMFYLRSRGIGEEAARALLVNAFAFDVTDKIKIPELRQHIEHLIASHIPVSK